MSGFPVLLGLLIIAIFIGAYALVFAEEKLHLRKSKPVMLAGGLIWILVAIGYVYEGHGDEVGDKLRHVMLEYAELLLFLLAAMSFVNALVERNVFEHLRTHLLAARLSTRGIFWITGLGAFVLSPIADNLTTALVMGTVVLSSMGDDKKVLTPALINIVVAANAGGAFSPFGDITTLMIWQKGMVTFTEFFSLFLPAVATWVVPAVLMSATMPRQVSASEMAVAPIHKGGLTIALLFLGTIAGTVMMDHFLHLPPFAGMMLGLGVLNMYGYFLHGAEQRMLAQPTLASTAATNHDLWVERKPFNIFGILEKVEWDTLLFFYGIMLCVGGLGAIGYLHGMSTLLYTDMGATAANILIGILSSIVDNIPLTFAVLTMQPDMPHFQWLLLTLTAGVGGSLLSIGSAAGVALMGIGRGKYSFVTHMKWSWAVMLGYAAGIIVHFGVNG